MFSVVLDVNIEDKILQFGIGFFLIQIVIFTKVKQNSLTHKKVLISCIF